MPLIRFFPTRAICLAARVNVWGAGKPLRAGAYMAHEKVPGAPFYEGFKAHLVGMGETGRSLWIAVAVMSSRWLESEFDTSGTPVSSRHATFPTPFSFLTHGTIYYNQCHTEPLLHLASQS